MCGASHQACRSFRSLKRFSRLTDALGANLAVTVRALAGEGAQCVDALLARLAVVLISLALVNVCTGK